MRKLFLLVYLFSAGMAFGQAHEIGLTLGGLLRQDRGATPSRLTLTGGTAWQANYAYRLVHGRAQLSGEIHFLGNAQRRVASSNNSSTRDIATIYLTPGIRVKSAPERLVAPYVAIGAGAAFYQQSLFQIDGRPNTAPRNVARATLDFGGGIDMRLRRWVGLRGEIRDFYSGSPAYNLPNLSASQHNVVAGGGFVLKLGE